MNFKILKMIFIFCFIQYSCDVLLLEYGFIEVFMNDGILYLNIDMVRFYFHIILSFEEGLNYDVGSNIIVL